MRIKTSNSVEIKPSVYCDEYKNYTNFDSMHFFVPIRFQM